MARRSLKPQLNQIRAWVRQGRTDAWIAHQLEISASELREFRSQHDLSADDDDTGAGEVDLRDEIEAEIEAAAAEAETDDAEEEVEEESADTEDEDEDEREEPESKSESDSEKPQSGDRSGRSRSGGGRSPDGGESRGQNGEGGQRRRRRRGRRGGRGRRRKAIEATFDHGESEGYGLWLDPAVQDNPIYSQHWAGKREVTVTLEPDQIVIRRAGAPERGDSGEND